MKQMEKITVRIFSLEKNDNTANCDFPLDKNSLCVRFRCLMLCFCVFAEVRCPTLTHPENGRHHSSGERFRLGQEVIFTCGSGYSMIGEQTLRCEFDSETEEGVWSSAKPRCSREFLFQDYLFSSTRQFLAC